MMEIREIQTEPSYQPDNLAELDRVLKTQQESFRETPYESFETRVNNLKVLKNLILENQQSIIDAISQDFGHRSSDETITGDILTTISGINYHLKKLKRWMKPESRSVSKILQPATAHIMYQPLGVIGIIAPWNYPLFLSLGPLTTALAAGNNAMIKMSEYTPLTSALIKSLLIEVFPENKVFVTGGDAEEATKFSSLKFNHLFFTGSTEIGQKVMMAAAKNLVPVTLELGGKSPAIIDPAIDIKLAVSRFILAKTLNAGQTCVAPDYVFCKSSKLDELVETIKNQYSKMYPQENTQKDCTCIINDREYARLDSLVTDAKEKGGTIIRLQNYSTEKGRRFPLTLILNTKDTMRVMNEEIFGPILPILDFESITQCIDYINNKPRPLALYIYSFDYDFQRKILQNTHSGGVCINDAALQVANEDLPFGGIGDSGMGSYHGFEGFKTFSHAKSVFKRGKINLSPLLFPPYGKKIHALFYKFFIR